MFVAVPLTGFAFQHDERRKVYGAAHAYGADPLESIRYAYWSIDPYLNHGNFRPIGRFAESLEHGFVFEAAEATGLAPHAVHGIVRLVMVALLALIASRVVAALVRSAGATRHQPVVAVFPMVLSTALVANGPGSPLILFPFVFMGAAMLILAICLAAARDDDMRPRPLKRREWLSMTLLGAAAAATYDLVYTAPVLAAAFVAARAAAAGTHPRVVVRTAAVRRWTALSIGFMAVLIPTRIAIADRCAQQTCYVGSDLSLSGDVLGVWAGRLLTGAPPAGWHYNSRKARLSGLDLALPDLLGNSLLVLLVLGIVAVVAVAIIGAEPGHRLESTAGERQAASAGQGGSPRWWRLAAALGMFGAAMAGSSALTASLTRHLQEESPRIGQAWRETLLTQVGWSFLLAAVIAAIFASSRRWKPRAAAYAVTAILGVGLAVTLLANARIAETFRHDPLASITSQISEATISLDTTEGGNVRRCSLIDAYTELTPATKFVAGQKVLKDLDRLMLDRHGWPFCDRARLGG